MNEKTVKRLHSQRKIVKTRDAVLFWAASAASGKSFDEAKMIMSSVVASDGSQSMVKMYADYPTYGCLFDRTYEGKLVNGENAVQRFFRVFASGQEDPWFLALLQLFKIDVAHIEAFFHGGAVNVPAEIAKAPLTLDELNAEHLRYCNFEFCKPGGVCPIRVRLDFGTPEDEILRTIEEMREERAQQVEAEVPLEEAELLEQQHVVQHVVPTQIELDQSVVQQLAFDDINGVNHHGQFVSENLHALFDMPVSLPMTPIKETKRAEKRPREEESIVDETAQKKIKELEMEIRLLKMAAELKAAQEKIEAMEKEKQVDRYFPPVLPFQNKTGMETMVVEQVEKIN